MGQLFKHWTVFFCLLCQDGFAVRVFTISQWKSSLAVHVFAVTVLQLSLNKKHASFPEFSPSCVDLHCLPPFDTT